MPAVEDWRREFETVYGRRPRLSDARIRAILATRRPAGSYLPMMAEPDEEFPEPSTRVRPTPLSGADPTPPEYVSPEAPISPAAGQWWVGTRPRARTMAEAQQRFEPPEFDAGDRRLVEPVDGAPTYAREE